MPANYRIGQSFTPTLSGLKYVTVNLNVGQDTFRTTLRMSIFQRAGFAGTNLGRSNVVAIASSTNQAYTFSSSSLISLTPSEVYTLAIGSSSGGYQVRYTADNLYTRGNHYQAGNLTCPGIANTSVDMQFVEGIAAAPEPGTWALMIVGSGIVGGTRRRRRRIGARRRTPKLAA